MPPDLASLTTEKHFKLSTFVDLLKRWGEIQNLTSKADRDQLWSRHVQDSLQLLDLVPDRPLEWIDLGSGGGFPGVVIAIAKPDVEMTLVESNRRKAAFLLQAATTCGVRFHVKPQRIESLPYRSYDVVSARALAPLPALFALAHGFFGPETLGLFPKGTNAAIEVEKAREEFSFTAWQIPSATEDGASIVCVKDLKRL
ncbi:MAG: 16S rRNA (guanine(527)-N(7))-methyltransferase RsmG [Devosia sp.]